MSIYVWLPFTVCFVLSLVISIAMIFVVLKQNKTRAAYIQLRAVSEAKDVAISLRDQRLASQARVIASQEETIKTLRGARNG